MASAGEFRERHVSDFWRLLNRWLTLFLLILSLGVVFFFFWPEIHKLRGLQGEIEALEGEVQTLQAQRDAKLRERTLLQHDLEYLEILARDKIGLAKPGETVVRFANEREGAAKE